LLDENDGGSAGDDEEVRRQGERNIARSTVRIVCTDYQTFSITKTEKSCVPFVSPSKAAHPRMKTDARRVVDPGGCAATDPSRQKVPRHETRGSRLVAPNGRHIQIRETTARIAVPVFDHRPAVRGHGNICRVYAAAT
jgi:hypothetical protein